MSRQSMLKILFAAIFLTLLGYNLWASFQQPVWQWGGLTTGPDLSLKDVAEKVAATAAAENNS